MSAREFILPDLGEGLTEAEIARWLVQEGEEVREDQPLVEVQTDKTTVEIPSPRGGTVRLIAFVDESEFVVQVADTGIGMAKEDIPHALERFGQLDSDLNRKYEGTGLGLPLTKKLAELHGGRLEIESELCVGTKVTVAFPAERLIEQSAAA